MKELSNYDFLGRRSVYISSFSFPLIFWMPSLSRPPRPYITISVGATNCFIGKGFLFSCASSANFFKVVSVFVNRIDELSLVCDLADRHTIINTNDKRLTLLYNCMVCGLF